MSKAIAQVAAAKGWGDVLNTFTNTAAFDTRAALEELTAIPTGRGTNLADVAAFKITDPREFLGTRDEVVDAFARGDQSMVNHLERTRRANPRPRSRRRLRRLTGRHHGRII